MTSSCVLCARNDVIFIVCPSDDADIMIDKQQELAFANLAGELQSRGYGLVRWSNAEPKPFKVFRLNAQPIAQRDHTGAVVANFSWSFPFLDVFFWDAALKTSSANLYPIPVARMHFPGETNVVKLFDFLPFRDSVFDGRVFPVPRNTSAVVSAMYSDFLNTCVSSTWSAPLDLLLCSLCWCLAPSHFRTHRIHSLEISDPNGKLSVACDDLIFMHPRGPRGIDFDV